MKLMQMRSHDHVVSLRPKPYGKSNRKERISTNQFTPRNKLSNQLHYIKQVVSTRKRKCSSEKTFRIFIPEVDYKNSRRALDSSEDNDTLAGPNQDVEEESIQQRLTCMDLCESEKKKKRKDALKDNSVAYLRKRERQSE